MKTNNIIQEKSFAFAIRIVDTYKYLTSEEREYVLSKQMLKSGTSIGANVEEAIGGLSTADFVFKLTIAYKEARETRYWIKLLYATEYLEEDIADGLLMEVNEICKIIAKILITMKRDGKN